jgi:hypothetical protein
MTAATTSIARGSRRIVALFVVGALALGLLGLASNWGADAALANLGPVDAATLIPAWYTDSNGTSLQPCLDGPPLCFGTAADLLDPNQGEAFYQLANADLNTAVGAGFAEFALEAALFSGPPEMSVFQRMRFRFNTPNPGTFTITHPFGQQSYNVASVGPAFEINDTVDAGCFGSAFNTCSDGVAPDFDAALQGPMDSFLQWDPTVAPAAPAGFTGDAGSPHAIIGSPLGQNFVRLDGPNIGGPGIDTIQTSLFSVMGKRLPGVSAAPASVAFADTHIGTPSAPTAIKLTNAGTAAVTFTASIVGANGADFSLPGGGTCTASIPAGSSCTVNVAFSPAVGAVGPRSATLNVAHTSLGSPTTVALSGSALPAIPATPTGTPAPGTFVGPQQVRLAAASPGTIHFTLDGSPASIASPTATGPISLGVGTTTIRAVTADALNVVGLEATLTYTVASVSGSTVDRPFFNIANASTPLVVSGSSVNAPAITVSLDDANAVTPAVSAAAVITPVASGQTWAASFSPAQVTGLADGSLVATVRVGTALAGTATLVKDTIAPPAPTASLPSATYQDGQAVTLNDGDLSAAIHIVTNAAVAADSPIYTRGTSISVNNSLTIRAMAVDPAGNASPASSFAYTIIFGTRVAPASRALGSAVVAQSTAPSSITLTNTSPSDVGFISASLGGANGSDFSVTGGTCTTAVPLAANGGSCTVEVTLTPTAAGARSATLSIADSSPTSSHPVALTGTGIAKVLAISAGPTLVDFLKIPTGTTSAELPVTITNTGNTSVPITGASISGANANQFRVTSNNCSTLAPRATCTVGVIFAPTAKSNAAGTLTVLATGAPSATVSLKGVGDKPLAAPAIPPPPAGPRATISAAPTTLSFNKVVLNTTSTQVITVTSTGTVATPVVALLGGANANQYSLASTCPALLDPGLSCALALTFQPTVRSNANATVTVTGGTNSATITVKGSVK